MSARKNKKPPLIPPQPVEAKALHAKEQGGNLPKWTPVAIVVFTGLLYWHSLQNNFTVFDDDFYIINNPFLKNFSLRGIWAIFTSFYSANYHPLTTLTWFFEYNLFGLNPLPFHLVNVVLHLLNTWLVFILAERLSGKKVTALVVSVLFAVHPMHVESVAWISERKDVLYTLFYLLSLLAYLRYIRSGLQAKHYIACLLLFLASLFSKSAAVTLPVLLIAIDFYQGRKIDARAMLEKIPFFLLSILFGILAILSQRAGGALNGLMASYGFINGIFLVTSGVAFYIVWLAAPFSLAVMHYFPDPHNGLLPWPYYVSLPFILVLIWLCTRRTAYRKEIFFGVSFFLITVSVMLQIVSVGSALTAERYSYVPSIGFFYILGQWLANRYSTHRRNLVMGLFAAVIAVYAVITWNRISVWKEDRLLFNDMIETYPGVYYGYWLRGNLEKKEGNLPAALANYTQSIKLNPKFADAVFNRGTTYDALGDTRAALADFNRAVELNPKQADVYNNRGWLLFRQGNRQAAMRDYKSAIAADPNYAGAYNNRGWAYQLSGDTISAMHDYDKAIELNPVFVLPYKNRAALKTRSHDYAGAIKDYDHLVSIDPGDNSVYYYRGLAHFYMKDMASACEDWKKAQQLGNADAGKYIGQYCR
jgi:protein O-mannosyl-transferase